MEETTIQLGFNPGPGRTPFILGCLDTRGNIHFWSNEGKSKRYSQRWARMLGKPTNTAEIFKKVYPTVALPSNHPIGYELRE